AGPRAERPASTLQDLRRTTPRAHRTTLGSRSMSTGSTHAGSPAVVDEFNPFQAMAQRFNVAADHLGLDAGIRDVLRTPDRELTVSIPVLMDDGSIKIFTGYRVQHNFSRGPCKGGI